MGDEDNFNDLDNFSVIRKKKKKKAFIPDAIKSTSPDTESGEAGKESREANDTAEKGENNAVTQPAEPELGAMDVDLDFNLPKKKKKKRPVKFDDADEPKEEVEVIEEADKDTESVSVQPTDESSAALGSSWANSDRDYSYDELLERVFYIIQQKNPNLAKGEKRRLVIRTLQVLRVGTKKTSFANFLDICKSVHRLPRHVQSFLLAELGTSGSVDANSQLIIKGKFQPKQIESVLRKYIKEYVVCQTCRSPDTILQKDTRLFFLQCETCGSRRSVASIKSGFQAVTSKRAAIRAKTA